MGIRLRNQRDLLGSAHSGAERGVRKKPGATQLTWMLSGAHSTAMTLVNCIMPPLLTP